MPGSASRARRRRRTPITEPRSAGGGRPGGRGDVRVFLLVTSLSAFLDQLSKALAVIFLEVSRPVPVLGSLLRFTLIHNRGAAFGISLGSSSDLLLLGISSVAIVIIVYHYVRTSPDRLRQHLMYGLITGGAVGNLIDRIAKGEVVDFIDCGIGAIRWPIFNLADVAVTIGALLLLLHSFGRHVAAPDGRTRP